MDRELQSDHLRWLTQAERCRIARAVSFLMLALKPHVGILPSGSEINHLCDSKGLLCCCDVSCAVIQCDKTPCIYPTLSAKLRTQFSVTDQHYALIVTLLFDTQAPTCFGIHVPSSGSFLCHYELLEGSGYVVGHVL
jgi:hypothetical protein